MKVRRLRGPGKQLRGAELKERIGSVLQEFVREAELRGEKPTISFGDLAKLIPCSKTTIYKYEGYVEEFIKDTSIYRARRTGSAKASELVKIVDRQYEKIEQLSSELDALRRHHANLYRRMLLGSSDLSSLVLEEGMVSSAKSGFCVFCGAQSAGETYGKVHRLSK
jgi:hypothetical protein